MAGGASSGAKSSKKIGKYELLEKLGQGTYAKVFRAVCSETQKEYAVKCFLKEDLAKHPKGEGHLHREIGVMSSLYGHRNVIRMEGILQTASRFYVVMELASGGDLHTILMKESLSHETTRRHFQELISAVWFCHAHHIAHRDIKPENLLLSKDGVLKLTDFGLSNVQKINEAGKVPSDFRLKTVCGTPNYVAPEVFSDSSKGYNGFQADIWSCAVVLYHMYSGKLPFVGSTLQSLLGKIREGDPAPCPTMDESARELIWQMLVKDPTKRITLETVVEHPWFLVDFDKALLRETGEIPLPPELRQKSG